MHSPELFILDEPTAGLDPIMQREFLALVRERRSQAVGGDPVRGRIAGSGGSKNGPHLREQRAGRAAAPDGRRTRSLGRRSHRHVAVEGSTSELLKVAAPYDVTNIVTHEADLEAIFLDYYSDR